MQLAGPEDLMSNDVPIPVHGKLVDRLGLEIDVRRFGRGARTPA